jgi:hypothetical protein
MKSLLTAVAGKLIPGICFLFIVATTQAQSTNNPAGQSESATLVKYLGTQDDMIVFNVSYSNPDGGKFMLTVKDQDGTQLYQNVFSEKSFYKQFRLPRTDKDRIVFILHNAHDADVVKTFEINVNSRFIQEVAVKKL